MLDIKFLRENPEIVKQNIRNKFQDAKLPLVDEVIVLDKENREIKQEVEVLRAERNRLSKTIGGLMGQGKKEEAEQVKAQVAQQADRLKELEAKEIRFDESGDITVYIGKVEAMLGQDEYMEEKIANLRAILKKMGNESGTLHLESFTGKNDTATFRPSDEPETETETETDAAGDTGGDDTSAAGDAGTGSDSSTAGDATVGNDADDSGAASSDDNVDGSQDQAGDSSATISMVFDSSGTLVYNVHVENGTVVDANGNPVSGCSVDSDGYVVDAYMNRFDPDTGELVQ